LKPSAKQLRGYNMDERLILGDACVSEGVAALLVIEPRFKFAVERVGPLPLRLTGEGFGALLHAIVGQQVSTSSAAAIWARVQQAGFAEPTKWTGAPDEDLQACGLSRPKIRYGRALAAAEIDYAALHQQSADDVLKTLTSVIGIGQWTAEIYAMFSLGRADVFAHGDLALQEAYRILFDAPARPTEKQMRQIAAAWTPWRSVAARILWAYYRVAKNREGVIN
jgi:DNA-3-methyladenine glycosylase II